MNLVELFIPLQNNDGVPFPLAHYASIEKELSERFGGVTSYPRTPATGLWEAANSASQRDELLIYEVMTPEIDRAWWAAFRAKLEKVLRQERIVIRTQEVEML
jgi:hypothetical protein